MGEMSECEFHYRWEWKLASPQALWPLVADTGVPSSERRAGPAPLANARRRLRLWRLGVPVEWIEQPAGKTHRDTDSRKLTLMLNLIGENRRLSAS